MVYKWVLILFVYLSLGAEVKEIIDINVKTKVVFGTNEFYTK